MGKKTTSRRVRRRLEDEAILGLTLEGDAQLEQLDDDGGKVVEEQVVVLGVALDVLEEDGVLDQGHVGGQHHQGLCARVLVLFGALPALPPPLLLEQQAVVVVGQHRRGKRPGSLEAGAGRVASSWRGGWVG